MNPRTASQRESAVAAPADHENDAWLPEGWTVVSMDELLMPGGLFDGPFGSSLKTSDYVDVGVRVIRLENVGNLEFKSDKRTYISAEKYQSLKKHTVVPGDIIFGSFVDQRVRVCLLPQLDTPAIAKADCFCVRTCDELVDSKFLASFLARDETRDDLVSHIHGATRPRINTTQLRQLRIKLAPLAEQRRIVAKVEELLGRVSAARERLTRVPAILKRFRQSVLAAACSGRLTEDWRERNADVQPAAEILQMIEAKRRSSTILGRPVPRRSNGEHIEEVAREYIIPDEWTTCRVEQIATVQLGGTPSRKEPTYWNGSIPWVSSGEVANCRIQRTAERITAEGLKNSSAKLYPPGSVLIAMIGEGKTRGQAAILKIEACTNQNSAGLIFDCGGVSPEYIWYWALCEYESTRSGGRGGAQPALNGEKVRALRLPLPPLAEQREIVRRVEALFKLADAVETKIAAGMARVKKLTQAILAKAFRGELVPTEAELARREGRDFEPASVLLERIRAARTQETSGKRPARSPRRK
jgi:type I restriction enzyme S subunit